MDHDGREEELWQPPGDESREDWLARHGSTKKVYDEIKALVIRCKTLMIEKEGTKVSRIV